MSSWQSSSILYSMYKILSWVTQLVFKKSIFPLSLHSQKKKKKSFQDTYLRFKSYFISYSKSTIKYYSTFYPNVQDNLDRKVLLGPAVWYMLFYIIQCEGKGWVSTVTAALWRNHKNTKRSLSFLQHGFVPQSKSFWPKVFGVADWGEN